MTVGAPARPVGGASVRVLFLASTLRRGGAERIVVETAVGLQREHGFHCSMVCLRDEGPLGEELRTRGVATESNLAAGRFDPLGLVRLSRAMSRERPDVLYMLDHRNAVLYGVPASLAARVRKRAMAVHTMGLCGGGRSVPRSVRVLLPWMDAVIAVAKGQMRYLEEAEGIPAEKMVYVPNGVDVARFRPAVDDGEKSEARRALGLPANGLIVATLSVLRPEKGHELFLKTAALLSKDCPGVTFAVLGDGPERERLGEAVRRMGLESRVCFTGWVPDAASALRALDIVVFSSKPVVETAPLAGLEAMACGVPVVAFDVGALRELVEDGVNGLLVPAGDHAALAEGIGRLLEDGPLRRRMGARARAAVEMTYRLDGCVAASAELLGRLAGAGGDRRETQ